jgi:hypothetical protein
MTGGDIEKHQFISPGLAVAASQLHRITGIAQPHKIHALDDTTVSDIQAGNQAKGNHQAFGPASLVELLKKDATGTVTDFRTTDGKGIGVVVELSNGATCWFFDDEIAPA